MQGLGDQGLEEVGGSGQWSVVSGPLTDGDSGGCCLPDCDGLIDLSDSPVRIHFDVRAA